MATLSSQVTRRRILQALSSTPALVAAGLGEKGRALAVTLPLQPQFAYVGTADSTLHVFRAEGAGWKLLQRVSSQRPAHLVVDGSQSTLYVANQVTQHERLPTGTVEAYRIHPTSGRLRLLTRQPLSLSATSPRRLAISPDGASLVVAAYEGGIYNLLPIGGNGELHPPSGIMKVTGVSAHPIHQQSAHPHTILFDAAGRHVLATDLGCDCIRAFRVESGKFIRTCQVSTPAGYGPGAMVFHPGGSLLYVLPALHRAASCYRYCGESGQLQALAEPLTDSRKALGAAAVFHPLGEMLYGLSRVDSNTHLAGWRVDAASGALSQVTGQNLGCLRPDILQITADGRNLFFCDSRQGALFTVEITRPGTHLSEPKTLFTVAAPQSFVFTYCL